MAVSVEVNGKLVNIDAVFKDSQGKAVAAPVGATYGWEVSSGASSISVEGSGAGGVIGKVTPIAVGTGTVKLTVSGGGLASPLVGTLEITVIAMEPATVELNGTVVDNA